MATLTGSNLYKFPTNVLPSLLLWGEPCNVDLISEKVTLLAQACPRFFWNEQK